jgi:hypothetical protein
MRVFFLSVEKLNKCNFSTVKLRRVMAVNVVEGVLGLSLVVMSRILNKFIGEVK